MGDKTPELSVNALLNGADAYAGLLPPAHVLKNVHVPELWRNRWNGGARLYSSYMGQNLTNETQMRLSLQLAEGWSGTLGELVDCCKDCEVDGTNAASGEQFVLLDEPKGLTWGEASLTDTLMTLSWTVGLTRMQEWRVRYGGQWEGKDPEIWLEFAWNEGVRRRNGEILKNVVKHPALTGRLRQKLATDLKSVKLKQAWLCNPNVRGDELKTSYQENRASLEDVRARQAKLKGVSLADGGFKTKFEEVLASGHFQGWTRWMYYNGDITTEKLPSGQTVAKVNGWNLTEGEVLAFVDVNGELVYPDAGVARKTKKRRVQASVNLAQLLGDSSLDAATQKKVAGAMLSLVEETPKGN